MRERIMVKKSQHEDPFVMPAGSLIIVDTTYPHSPRTIG